MSRTFNFSAGPAALPEPVLRQAQEELLEWGGERASVMEVSHRGAAFVAAAEEAERDLRDLLAVPANYKVLFLQGGATQHFAQIPMNIASPERAADYIVTGAWGQKAVSEGKPYVKARVAASSEAVNFTAIPARSEWQLAPMRPTCTTPRTRPSTASSSTRCRTRERCHWWATSVRPFFRARSISQLTVSSTPARRRTSVPRDWWC
jgi:phosphoserine aminotransferase